MTRVARYAIAQVAGPIALFLIATLALELLGTDLYQLVGTIVERGIPFGVVVQMLLLRAPYWLLHTIPIALVLGILTGLGRANQDLEYRALITAGMAPVSLLGPLLALGVAFGGLAYGLAEYVVPPSLLKYKELVRRHAPEVTEEGERLADVRLFFARPMEQGGEIVYVGRREPRTSSYSRLLVVRPDGEGGSAVLLARSARMEAGVLVAEHGVLYPDLAAADDEIPAQRFDEREMELAEGFLAGLRGASDSLTEHTPDILEDIREAIDFGASRAVLARQIMDLHLRWALPASNVLLVLVVFPLALWGGRSRGYSHVFAGLALFGAFFGLLNLAKSLGHQEFLDPVTAAWLPNAVFLAVGAWLMDRMPR